MGGVVMIVSISIFSYFYGGMDGDGGVGKRREGGVPLSLGVHTPIARTGAHNYQPTFSFVKRSPKKIKSRIPTITKEAKAPLSNPYSVLARARDTYTQLRPPCFD